jgi:hypothetical protein
MRLALLILAAGLGLWAQSPNPLYEWSEEEWKRWIGSTPDRRVTLILLPDGAPKTTKAGEYVLGYGGQEHEDLSLANPRFFQYLDWVIRRLDSRGFEIRILPAERGSTVVTRAAPDRLFEWGRYLGRRYMKAKRIVWLRYKDGSLAESERGIRAIDSLHRWETFDIKPQ